MAFYKYARVSTEKQEIARQLDAFAQYEKEKNIITNDLFVDYYSGKTFNRPEYQKLKAILKPNDYLIVKEVDRLGRNWDDIKKEWQELKNQNINIIIIDMPILSDALPNEKPPIEGLDLRFIKEQILTLMCYSAQKEREKISQRTKEGLKSVKLNGSKSGRPIGRPRTSSNQNGFIKALNYIINNNVGQAKACLMCNYPLTTFNKDIKKLYNKYNTKDYAEILSKLKEEQQESEANH